jgi:CobQ-like glutamine amidotransferase family enzyme
MKIRVGHLYPEYLNIYADRGNIAVFRRRAAARGHDLELRSVSLGDVLDPSAHDLLYIGGGQDREQGLIAPDLAAKGLPFAAATNFSAVATGGVTDRSCPALGSSVTRPSPVKCG